MEDIKADIVVIGSGPSGQKAAIQASKLGKSVVVVERELEPGGACLYSGTILSKTFRESVVDLTCFYEHHFEGNDCIVPEVTFNDLNMRLLQVITEERNIIIRQFKKNNIRLVQGTARFENNHTLIIVDSEQLNLAECLKHFKGTK